MNVCYALSQLHKSTNNLKINCRMFTFRISQKQMSDSDEFCIFNKT